jgi:uncharacterized protein YpuA (DUF1002 family)
LLHQINTTMKYRPIKPNEITEQDVREVANKLNIGITDDQIKEVIENYSPEDDTTSNWSEIVESLIYNLKD